MSLVCMRDSIYQYLTPHIWTKLKLHILYIQDDTENIVVYNSLQI